jgi:glycosidase
MTVFAWRRGVAIILALLPAFAASARQDDAPMPDAPVPAQASPPLRPQDVVHEFVAISGGLGLADIRITVPSGTLEEGRVVINPQTPGHTRDPLTIPLVRMPTHPGSPTELWMARLWCPPERSDPPASVVSYLVQLQPRLKTIKPLTFGPLTGDASPPPHLRTPDWAKGVVWYQIFPERFRNANPANDPARVLGAEFFNPGWSADWYTVTPDELEHHRAIAWGKLPREAVDPVRRGGQFFNVVYNRRYGGDLEGVVEKLDELVDLGATGIYFNPVFHARSLHKYDATDYRHVDPTLAGTPDPAGAPTGETADPSTWTWTAADRFLVDVLLPEAHKRGIRVILDGVWNHVGLDFWAFRDVMARGRSSPYADWFDARFVPEDSTGLAEYRRTYPTLDIRPGALIAWNAWNRRNGTLPVFSRSRQGRFHPAVEAHIFGVTRRWMDPNADGDPSDGIDGWRLDVVPDVPMPFWTAWRELVKSINPDAVLIAEVWFDAKDYFEGKAFDAQMNYPFAMPAVDWLGVRTPGAANSSDRLARRLDEAFGHRPQVDLVQMNLLGSHDTERLASMLANPGREYDQRGDPVSNPGYRTSRPSPEVYDLVVLATAWQATYPGSPSIYYGDEYGMHGADDPDCRKPLPWPDLGPPANPDDAPEPGLRERMRAWLRLRSDPELGPVLRYGMVRHIQTGNPDVFAFERRVNGSAVVVVLNRGAMAFRATVPVASRSDADPRDLMVPPRSGRWWSVR